MDSRQINAANRNLPTPDCKLYVKSSFATIRWNKLRFSFGIPLNLYASASMSRAALLFGEDNITGDRLRVAFSTAWSCETLPR